MIKIEDEIQSKEIISSNVRLNDMIFVMDTEYKTKEEYEKTVQKCFESNGQNSVDYVMNTYVRLSSLSKELQQEIRKELKNNLNQQ